MTLTELKTRCEQAKITYRYGIAEDGVQPPFLIGIVDDSRYIELSYITYLKQKIWKWKIQ